MRIILLSLLDLILFTVLLFRTYNLAGMPGTPSDDDDGVINVHQLRRLCPNLAQLYVQLFQRAFSLHMSGQFDDAVTLYWQIRNAELSTGERIDLFKACPRVEQNFLLAKSRRKGTPLH